MLRKIIKIDENKCVGCGLCVSACHEGAIEMVDGKAKLLRDDYCDGLGNCLPVCPTNAITFETREAAQFDKRAVEEKRVQKSSFSGCPGAQAREIGKKGAVAPPPASTQSSEPESDSELKQWPIQIKLVPVNAPYFDEANLLVAADCAAYAYREFHTKYMKNRVTIIGCPKLDECDYSEKLTEILKVNSIKSITVVRMEVPCCSGIVSAVKNALKESGKVIPWQIVNLSVEGKVLAD